MIRAGAVKICLMCLENLRLRICMNMKIRELEIIGRQRKH